MADNGNGNNDKVLVAFQLEDSLLGEFDSLARIHDRTRSAELRMAVRYWIDSQVELEHPKAEAAQILTAG